MLSNKTTMTIILRIISVFINTIVMTRMIPELKNTDMTGSPMRKEVLKNFNAIT